MTSAHAVSATSTPTRPSDQLDRSMLLDMYRRMLLIRRFEERAIQMYQLGKIGGFCHVYIGQEAIAVAQAAALRPDDPVITAYRDHGHALARGMDPRYAMAELFGKITGCSKGKGGSMHFFDIAHHMYGGHAIVGGHIPLGIGLAFAIQYSRQDRVCVCSFGDGALNQGTFHEAMNLAALWRLPIIFLCENNLYSMGTHIARGTSCADNLAVKAAAYGIPFYQVDGMDVLAVYDTLKTTADAVRGSTSRVLGAKEDRGAGPVFIEALTYRFKGHSISDPQKYRTKEEVRQYEEQDPILRFAEVLKQRGLADDAALRQIDDEVKLQVLQAVAFADESPPPPLEELWTDVYATPYPPYAQGEPPSMLKNSADH